jgi:hypothetical protein
MSGISSTPTCSDFAWINGSIAEFRIVGDGELVGFHAAGEDAEAQIADFHRPSQSRAQVRFNLRPEIIDIDQEGQDNGGDNEKSDDNADDFKSGFHSNASWKGGKNVEKESPTVYQTGRA